MLHGANRAGADSGGGPAGEPQPISTFVNLIFQQALLAGAERIEFSLEDPSSETGFRISYSSQSDNHELPPAAPSLFEPVVAALCDQAHVLHYLAGRVGGAIRLKPSDSPWHFRSDNLKRRVVLSRTEPPASA